MINIGRALKLMTSLHLTYWSVPAWCIIVLIPNAPMNPIITKSCSKIPKTPLLLIYFGDIYRTYAGMTAKIKPVTTPCKNLTIKKTTKLGTWMINWRTSAAMQKIKVRFLDKAITTFENLRAESRDSRKYQKRPQKRHWKLKKPWVSVWG